MGLARVDVRARAWSCGEPSRLARRHGGLRVAASLLLAAAGAVAAEPAGSAARYQVPAECPAREVWLEQLRARLPALPAAWAAVDGLVVSIEPRRNETGATDYHGLISARNARTTAREVRGPSCREVFDALVLVAALSLEESQAGVESEATAEPVLDAASATTAPPSSAARRGSWAALGLALVQTGIAPEPSFDVGLAALVRGPEPGIEPWLLVGFYAALNEQTVRVEEAVARFEHWSARLLAGAGRYPFEGPLALRPALGVDVGRVSGEGSGVSAASSDASLWLSVRGELRFEAVLAERLLVGAAAGVAVPLLRPRFYFEPGAVVFHAPAIGLEASGFAALLF